MNNYENCLMTKYTYKIYMIVNFDPHPTPKKKQIKQKQIKINKSASLLIVTPPPPPPPKKTRKKSGRCSKRAVRPALAISMKNSEEKNVLLASISCVVSW